MKHFIKPVSILLSLLMIVSVFTIVPLTASADVTTFTDTLTVDDTDARSTAYVDWTAHKGEDHADIESDAIYSGSSAKNYGGIQMRSKNNHSGIVTTASGGFADKVKIVWADTYANNNRYIQVYGSNTAYESAADLYSNSTKGTLLTTLSYAESDDYYDDNTDSYVCYNEFEVQGNYKYIGIRSLTGALYLKSYSVTWKTSLTAPVWTWAEDFSTASVTVTDDSGEHTINDGKIHVGNGYHKRR